MHSYSVYSLGSNQKQDFERGILDIRPDAKVFTFELAEYNMVPLDKRIDSIKYYNIGIGYTGVLAICSAHTNLLFLQRKICVCFLKYTQQALKSLWDVMHMHNHTYIDILKMDIEGRI